MSLRAIAAGLWLTLMAVSGLAHDVDGTWTGTMATPNGDVPVNFTFKAEGALLTGSTTGPDGGAVAIADGKVEGNDVSFTVTLDFGGMPFTMSYKGAVTAARIDFTIDIFGMPAQLVVKKAN